MRLLLRVNHKVQVALCEGRLLDARTVGWPVEGIHIHCDHRDSARRAPDGVRHRAMTRPECQAAAISLYNHHFFYLSGISTFRSASGSIQHTMVGKLIPDNYIVYIIVSMQSI